MEDVSTSYQKESNILIVKDGKLRFGKFCETDLIKIIPVFPQFSYVSTVTSLLNLV